MYRERRSLRRKRQNEEINVRTNLNTRQSKDFRNFIKYIQRKFRITGRTTRTQPSHCQAKTKAEAHGETKAFTTIQQGRTS